MAVMSRRHRRSAAPWNAQDVVVVFLCGAVLMVCAIIIAVMLLNIVKH